MAIRCDITQIAKVKKLARFSMLDEDGMLQEYELEVFPLKIGTIGAMAARFPSLFKLLDKKSGFGPADIMGLGDDVTAAIIAAAVGRAGDDAAEESALSFTPEAQVAVLDACLSISFPQGVVPFVTGVVLLVERLAPAEVKEAMRAAQAAS